ncbi:MAG: MOSC domain-containing protein [Aestuariivirgaceae bacterium]|nr:MOSC domain-containing protein [Aestuariivirgaceae bacterium]
MPLMSKARSVGKVEMLLLAPDRTAGLEKSATGSLSLTFNGIAGDCHSGLLRASDSRTLQQYPRDTPIRNVRQVTLLSVEELGQVAAAMEIPEVKPEWVGANLVTSGIANLTLLPPSTRMQFPSGATLVVDMENAPCRQVADVIRQHHGDKGLTFVKHATHKRGLTAWVEREGAIAVGDAITLWIPPQRHWDDNAPRLL